MYPMHLHADVHQNNDKVLTRAIALYMLIHLFLNEHASDVGADYEDHAGDCVSNGEQGG